MSPIILLSTLLSSPAPGGQVTLPAAEWDRMLGEVDAARRGDRPSIPVAPIDRKLEGTFRKGLLSATLTTRFAYLGTAGHVRVPVLDGSASLGEVLLDGKKSSLLREGDLYTIGVEAPGTHEVKLKLYWGREQERFTRRVSLRLPEAGATSVSILVPETDIEAKLVHGALSAERAVPGGTRLEGHLDASGLLDLSWNRRLSHKAQEAVRTEARLSAVFTIHEALASGLAVFDLDVLEGETDRVDLRIPPELEVVGVEGDAVLQWRTEASNKGQLIVLLRYLVADHVRINVHFQHPVDPKLAKLELPLPPEGTPFTGSLGVQAPAGLDVRVSSVEAAEQLSLRDMPAELGDLSSSPLLYSFRFSEPPRIQLAIARHQEVELTSTLIDEIQASTVVIESGIEVTKLKLRIRNNTRQYLTMRLPKGAILTHSQIDGQPVRPAVAAASGNAPHESEALLLPLRQSEKLGGGRQQVHTVRANETLSAIANFYYSDPTQWRAILDDNRDRLNGPNDLRVGEQIRLPAKKGAVVEESSFVVELAYKRARPPLGNFGGLALELPETDVDAVNVIWHVYFPEALPPLAFDANLTQYSAIRYDPFRRVRDFWSEALMMRHAWAGEYSGKYRSILSQRKVIWQAEAEKKNEAEVVLSSFPLVGHRYRFKRILLGHETPRIEVSYAARGIASAVRWGAFLGSFGLGLLVLGARRQRTAVLAIASVALILALIGGHYFLGVHRRLLWGVDLALVVTVVRLRARPLVDAVAGVLRAPWTLPEKLKLKNLALLVASAIALWIILAFPLLLSTGALLGLLFLRWRRSWTAARAEVSHA